MFVKFCAIFLTLLVVGSFGKRSFKSYLHDADRRALNCQPNEFPCKDGTRCVPMKWTCDMEEDCDDASDERLNCPTDCSHANQFKCASGNECQSRDFVCDGTIDCHDGSDEQNCENFVCPDGEIKCDNHLCIEAAWKCDGYNDCGNNWDETGCSG
ncbi:low-density lipoprotein receptor-related protein 4-like [Physella acuta]|uniref:low-density lipoprotein receptor-related protein 4-like n=1 Tax=Physella acuta TaxID=109671 RepID=UPI0027DCFE11|nr:low-density lipoprotein receptor-related protein 4-like [Physella acuta]